jgi:proton-translocating NADH-quinone oxidoreductase chain N
MVINMNYLGYAAESFLFVPLAAIILNNIFPKKRTEDRFYILTGAVAVIQIIASIVAFYLMDVNGLQKYDFSVLWDKNPGSDYFSINSISLVFLFNIGLVVFISVLVAARTIDTQKSSYVNLLMTLLVSMNGMVLVNDLFSLYVFLDVVGISSFIMIGMFQSKRGLEGSIKYLVISELATIFILTGLAFIFMKTGSLSYPMVGDAILKDTSDSRTLLIYGSLILMIAGFAIKTGAVPFHSWLPDAYQSADSSISVLLSGIVNKIAGVYGLVVLTRLFCGVPAIQASLAAIGILSIIIGALLALRQKHFKRIVAYSSVSQMGYILLGLSTGTTLGLIAAIAHVFSHATVKSTLFANAAALQEQVGTLKVKELGGLQSRMPVTALSSLVAFLSIAGIPPFVGFWSKLLIIMALWTSGNPVMAGCALCASILTGAYFLRLQKEVFFGATPSQLSGVTEITGSIKFAEILLTVLTSAVGIGFPLILVYMQSRGWI